MVTTDDGNEGLHIIRNKGAELEVFGTLAKPFAIDELQSMVHSALKQKRATTDAC